MMYTIIADKGKRFGRSGIYIYMTYIGSRKPARGYNSGHTWWRQKGCFILGWSAFIPESQFRVKDVPGVRYISWD